MQKGAKRELPFCFLHPPTDVVDKLNGIIFQIQPCCSHHPRGFSQARRIISKMIDDFGRFFLFFICCGKNTVQPIQRPGQRRKHENSQNPSKSKTQIRRNPPSVVGREDRLESSSSSHFLFPPQSLLARDGTDEWRKSNTINTQFHRTAAAH